MSLRRVFRRGVGVRFSQPEGRGFQFQTRVSTRRLSQPTKRVSGSPSPNEPEASVQERGWGEVLPTREGGFSKTRVSTRRLSQPTNRVSGSPSPNEPEASLWLVVTVEFVKSRRFSLDIDAEFLCSDQHTFANFRATGAAVEDSPLSRSRSYWALKGLDLQRRLDCAARYNRRRNSASPRLLTVRLPRFSPESETRKSNPQ